MAPPWKRRRLFFWTADDTENNTQPTSNKQPLVLPAFEHKVDEIDSTHTWSSMTSSAAEDSTGDETHEASPLRLQQRRDVVLRQETTVYASTVVIQADVIVSVDPAATSTSVTPSTTAPPATSQSASPDASPAPAQSVAQPTTTTAIAPATSLPISGSKSTADGIVPSTSLTSGLSSFSSSSLLEISSSYATIASKNITVAGDILTSNLTLPSTSSRASPPFPTLSSNSSLGYNATASSTTTFTSSSGTISLTTDSSETGLTTITTTGADGQPSTITTVVGAPIYTAPASPPPSEPTPDPGSSDPSPPPAGTIAGGVVGGAAGLAVLLLVAMLFVRWYRQRSKREHQTLLPASHPDSDSAHFVSRHPGMAESAGLRPFMSAIPLLSRHQQGDQDRGAAKGSLNGNTERGFQRLSGRKLPSAFSPGMEHGQQPPLPFTGQYRESGASSVYPPSTTLPPNPFVNRPGSTSPEDSSELSRQVSDEQMTIIPGPQRRPTIHNTNPSLLIPGTRSHTRHVSSSARTSGLIP